MPNKKVTKAKNLINKIDRAAGIQLTMILLIVVAYGIFLSVQKFLFDFESFRTKIVIINVLLASGILIEIVYFIWHTYKTDNKKEEEIKTDSNEKTEKSR